MGQTLSICRIGDLFLMQPDMKVSRDITKQNFDKISLCDKNLAELWAASQTSFIKKWNHDELEATLSVSLIWYCHTQQTTRETKQATMESKHFVPIFD